MGGRGGEGERRGDRGGAEGQLGLGGKAATFKCGQKAGVGLVIIIYIINITFLIFSNWFEG